MGCQTISRSNSNMSLSKSEHFFFVSFEKIWTGHCGADLNVSAQIVLLKEQMYLQETH